MFSQNFQKSFTGNGNRKMEAGNDSFGRVSRYRIPGIALVHVYQTSLVIFLYYFFIIYDIHVLTKKADAFILIHWWTFYQFNPVH